MMNQQQLSPKNPYKEENSCKKQTEKETRAKARFGIVVAAVVLLTMAAFGFIAFGLEEAGKEVKEGIEVLAYIIAFFMLVILYVAVSVVEAEILSCIHYFRFNQHKTKLLTALKITSVISAPLSMILCMMAYIYINVDGSFRSALLVVSIMPYIAVLLVRFVYYWYRVFQGEKGKTK